MTPSAGRLQRSVAVVAMALSTGCVGSATEPTTTKDSAPINTTIATTPGSTFDSVPNSPAEPDWPKALAANFIHRSSGAVFGTPISFPPSMYCDPCALVTLRDGRVLLVGPAHSIGYTAEIWDPNTGEWVTTGKPNTAGADLVNAVLLDDGRVLVALTSWEPDNGVEIYDPMEGSFRLLNHPVLLDLVLPRGTIPVVMADGRVLLATSSRGGVVFDPADESFSLVGIGTSDTVYQILAAVALTDGRVLLDGGGGGLTVYNPDTEEFISVRPLYPTERGTALSLLQDGRVLVTGGSAWTSTETVEDLGSDDAQIFDPTTDRFQAVAPMLEPRSHHSAVTLDDGRVAIIGGADGRVELFDPETAIFRRAPELARPRIRQSVAVLDDGTILVVGGHDERASIAGYTLDLTTNRTAEIYHPSRLSGEASPTPLSGFTLRLEVDFDRDRIESPNGAVSLLLTVPPGGLRGATYAAAQLIWSDGLNSQFLSSVHWLGRDGVVWGWASTKRSLPANCEQGCEIRESIPPPEEAEGEKLAVLLHIQYQDETPPEAERTTLTLVEGG